MTTPRQSALDAARPWALRLALLMTLLALTACDGLVQMRGRVLDDAGEPIAAADVYLGRPGESVRFEEQTDDQGCFYIGGMVSPGIRDYHLDVEKDGYEPFTQVSSNREETIVLVTLVGGGSGGESSAARLDPSAPELEPCP